MTHHMGKVRVGDHCVIGDPKPGREVWICTVEEDRHGKVVLMHYGRTFGAGYTNERREAAVNVYVIDVRDIVQDFPKWRWDPERAKAEIDRLKAAAHA